MGLGVDGEVSVGLDKEEGVVHVGYVGHGCKWVEEELF
jgi:hypothetical protein